MTVQAKDWALQGKSWQWAAKRTLDVSVAGAALVALCPLLLLLACLIRLDSPGPVFFRQTRSGYRGVPFHIYKLRSMRAGRDPEFAEAQAEAARQGLLLKAGNDPRITRIGRFLRATSLDEVPQLWNVVMGQMSLVGPRPLMEFMLEPHPEFRRLRAQVRPGLTGLWQVRARADNHSAQAMMPHDLEYLQQFSLWLDLKIALKTIPAVCCRHGAW